MDPSKTRRRFLVQMGVSAAAIALPLQLAQAGKPPAGGTTPSQPGYPPPPILIVPNVDAWLTAHPLVRNAIQWQQPNNTMLPYISWSAPSKAEFLDAFSRDYRGLPSGLPEVPTNISPPEQYNTIITQSDAWNLYIAHVAHSLAIELRGDLPWSLTQMPATELAILFDSKRLFSTRPDLGGYEMNGAYGGGYSTLAPPDFVYAFLKANDIPNHAKVAAGQVNSSVLYDAKMLAIGRLLAWCGDRMSHYVDANKPGAEMAHWQYHGCPPVARIIRGTVNAAFSPTIRHWTAGCFGTSAFLRAVARTMNLAVDIKYPFNTGHTVPYFLGVDSYLSHGDDPYNSLAQWSDDAVGPDLSFPKSMLLIPGYTYNAWFSPALGDVERSNNVGRRVSEIVVGRLPLGLLVEHVNDLQQGHSHADSLVALYLSATYTVAQLEAINLWGAMNSKIAWLGGADAITALYSKSLKLKET